MNIRLDWLYSNCIIFQVAVIARHLWSLGLLLFMMTKIAEVSLAELVREVIPFLVVMLGALVMVTLLPDMVLFLPRLAGYTG